MTESTHPGAADIIDLLRLAVSLAPPPVVDDWKPIKSFKDSERYRQVGRDKHKVRGRVKRRGESVMVRTPHTGGDGVKVNPRYRLDPGPDREPFIDTTKDPWRVPPIPSHPLAKEQEILGMRHRSLKHAARFFKVSTRTVAYHIERGTPERIGAGMFTIPVALGGHYYSSIKACAEALGVQAQTVGKAMKRGTLDQCGNRGRKSVEYEGRTFKSFKELAAHLGVSQSPVSVAVKRGTLAGCGKGKGHRTDLRENR